MTGTDLVRAAADELYSTDPEEFVARRRELAADAQRRGDAAAAKQIGAMRKPTRSAWTLNALARSDPSAFDEVDSLAGRLRDAERRLDGAQMRELSRERRRVVDGISRQAFAATGQHDPSAALRDEVTNTLLAAFADPDVASALRSGALLRGTQWDGFGSGARPELALVPAPSPAPSPAAAKRPARAAAGARRGADLAADRAAERERAARERQAEQERERRDRVEAATRQVEAAERELAEAEADEREHRDALQALDDQVAAARHEVDRAHARVRAARGQLRAVQRILGRAQGC